MTLISTRNGGNANAVGTADMSIDHFKCHLKENNHDYTTLLKENNRDYTPLMSAKTHAS
jgi:hypothetical protein